MFHRNRILWCRMGLAVLFWAIVLVQPADAAVSIEEISEGTFPACYRVSNASVEVWVSRDFGPRILRYSLVGEENLFAERPDIVLKNEWGAYKLWGGHRIWTSPEATPLTFAGDDQPVTLTKRVSDEETVFQFVGSAHPQTRLQQEIHLALEPEGTTARVRQLIRNVDDESKEIAVWALTIMAPGGRVFIPQPSRQGRLTPARALVLWDYTDLSDPRWSFGKTWMQLRAEDRFKGRQKIGLGNESGWLGYLKGKTIFTKVFPWSGRWEEYPDFGCNCEVYSDGGFVELESLSPRKTLAPGEAIAHEEVWLLLPGVDAGETEESLSAALEDHLPRIEQEARNLISTY